MMIDEIKTEYLIIFESKDAFCDNILSFNNLLKSNSEISINGDKLAYKDLTVGYLVQSEEINNSTQRYFHIRLICADLDKISTFELLLKIVRTILSKVSSRQIQTLWDDVSFYYANKAYPLIHEIENLMRKLITKFMLISVGVGWTKINVPVAVKDSIKKKGKDKLDDTSDYLYETDFIQLSNFLFDEYQTDNIASLIESLRTITDLKDVKIDELKSYIPKSNWERYFSKIVDCDYEYLKKRWETLYELRCKIAHNNRMNREDFDKTEKLVNEVKEKLNDAIENLDKLSISVEEKENIAESMIINTNELYGAFIMNYRKFEEEVFNLCKKVDLTPGGNYRAGTYSSTQALYKKGVIDKDILEKMVRIQKIRNRIVHENEACFTEQDLSNFTDLTNEIIFKLKGTDNT